MKQISFNDAAKLCAKASQPLFITPDGNKNLILMNEDVFSEYEEAKRVQAVLTGCAQLEKGETIDGATAFKQVREKYGYKI